MTRTMLVFFDFFFFEGYGAPRDQHVLTHSFPTRRSSDLPATALAAAEHRRPVPAIAAFTARQFEPALGERLPVRAIGTDGVAGFDDVVRAHGLKPPGE